MSNAQPEAGWYTDAFNAAGTAHYFGTPATGSAVRASCGRIVEIEDLQPESESLKRCTRCQKKEGL